MSDEPELVGTAEVAELLGISRQRVLQLLAVDRTFPRPHAVLRMGKVWLAADVHAWTSGRGRQSGRAMGR